MAEQQEWANLLAEIFEKLTQKHASITHDYGNLELQDKIRKEVTPTCIVSLTGKLSITAK